MLKASQKAAIALAAVLGTASAVHAQSWSDLSCSVGLVSVDENSFRYVRDGAPETVCKITVWPRFSPDLIMQCDNGRYMNLHIIDDYRIVFNGIEMHEITKEGAICD